MRLGSLRPKLPVRSGFSIPNTKKIPQFPFLTGDCFPSKPNSENCLTTTQYLEDQHNSHHHKDSILTPDIIIHHIIPHLNRNDIIKLAGVCFAWRNIIKSSPIDFEFTATGNKISNAGWSFFLSKLSNMGDVLSLFTKASFSYLKIQKSQFKSIFESPQITSLKFHHTNFNSTTLSSILRSSITELTLDSFNLSRKDLKIISNIGIDDNSMKMFSNIHIPHSLELWLTGLTDQGIKIHSKGKLRIHKLILRKCELTRDGVESLFQIKTLEELNVSEVQPRSEEKWITEYAQTLQIKITFYPYSFRSYQPFF
ncbi:hypothetical protein FDP41_000915 [Naegleria fowleri]|uniref:F-box domain-containing protein n=1 Tax=Naegleria fowleri TaxID=5763 RepID=A0A6A5BYS6_NAEFO|nr:uncharacterized protein FDP41_000915 [Naegleria fowleri]KAF0979762.1 hypothetical protein FDP41_000915 [Naegleria fowleri]